MHPYLLFHSLAEIASATISFGTFLFAWNTRRFQGSYLLAVGMAALFVGVFEALHCLAFPGMSVFPGYDANLSPQLHLSARVLQATAGLAGLLLFRRTLRARRMLAAFGVASAVLGVAIFSKSVPDLVVVPQGLTALKVAAEWTLVAAFVATAALLYRGRERFAPTVVRLLIAQTLAMAGCEACFSFYLRPYDPANFVGHILLLLAGALQYLAVLREGLVDPNATHFRELHRAQQEAQRSEAALRGILDATSESVWLFAPDGSVRMANQTALARLGRSGDTVRSVRDIGEVLSEELARTRYAMFREVLTSKQPREFEDRRDGIEFLHRLYPVVDRDGGVTGVAAFTQDITQQKRAQRVRQRYELVFKQSRDVILFVRREDGRILEANPAAEATYGYSHRELLAMSIAALRRSDMPSLSLAELEQAEREGLLFETIHQRRDGSEFPVEVSTRGAVVDGVRCMVSIVRDISERRHAERRERDARKQAERRAAELDAVLDSLAEALVVSDASGALVRTNPAFGRLFGPQEQWLGATIGDRIRRVELLDAEGRPVEPSRAPGQRALAGETVHGVLQHIRQRDGSLLSLATSAAPIRTAEGIQGTVVILVDVTERVRAENALREADQNKTEFLAVLSHELRNPLAPISNSVYILEKANPDAEQARRARATIRRQVDLLARLVNDLLDVTRISRNKVRLQLQRVDLNELVRRAVEDHRSLFDKAQVTLELRAEAGPVYVDGDPSRLTQVIGNLLTNAAKFTPPEGHAAVRLQLDESAGRAEISVADSGVGMTPEVRARVFEPFVQADATLDRSLGGLGLGLALVKGLVELHGGDVRAESAGPGSGSRFVVRFPLQDRGEIARARAADAPAAETARRVLLVEDNADAAASLREALELSGHAVAVAGNGTDGVQMARELRPEVIVCDLGLPGMNGYEVAKAVRADAALGATHLIALSGYALAEDVKRAAEAGFDEHLPKPPNIERLAELLRRGRSPRVNAS